MKYIAENQFLQFENMISKVEKVIPNKIGDRLVYFLEMIEGLGFTRSSSVFYSINSEPLDNGEIYVEFFVSVKEISNEELPEGYKFQSYWQVNNLISTRTLQNFSGIAKGQNRLSKHIKKKRFTPITPVFYLSVQDNEVIYTDIMVGVR